jgi:hypothetical protein
MNKFPTCPLLSQTYFILQKCFEGIVILFPIKKQELEQVDLWIYKKK